MAINDDLHRYKDVLKKQISHAFRIYLSIAILLSPFYLMTQANALITVRDWSITNVEKQGETAMATAEKKIILNGKNYIKTGTAKITPTPSQVARIFGRTAGALALTVAIEQILGTVDWVFDPDNNIVKYTNPNTSNKYIYSSRTPVAYSNYEDACKAGAKNLSSQYTNITISTIGAFNSTNQSICSFNQAGSYASISVTRTLNPAYDPNSDNQPKSLPLQTVANRVIDNAKTGEPKAQAAIAEAVDQILTDAQADPKASAALAREFDESSETKPADEPLDVKIKGKTTNPDGTKTESEFDIPVACDWMPLVCQAASVVITKPGEWAEDIKAAYNDAVDYFKEEPTNKDPEEIEIEQPEFEAEQVNLQGSTDCPQDSVSFSLMGKSYTLEMPYQPVCNALDFFRPAVLAVGAITSAYIIAGIRTKEDET